MDIGVRRPKQTAVRSVRASGGQEFGMTPSLLVLLLSLILMPCAQDLLGTVYQPNEAWERLLVGAGSEADRLLGCESERLDREGFRRAVADRIRPNFDQPGRLCAPTRLSSQIIV